MPVGSSGMTSAEMEKLFEKFWGQNATNFKTVITNPEEFKKLIDQMRKQTKQIADSMPVSKQFLNSLQGINAQLIDATEELEKFDEQIEEAVKEGRKNGDYRKAEQLRQEKLDRQSAVAKANFKASMNNLATGMFSVIGSIANASLDYAKSLQGGASGVQSATQAMVNKYKIEGEAAGVAGGLISGMGSVASAVGGKYLRPLGKLAEVAGQALGIFGQKAAEYAGKAAQFLGDELVKTQKAYTTTTQSGAMLAGGMTELRQRAADAGLDVEQFSNVIKASTESLQLMGLGQGEGAKRIGAVNKELRNSQFGTQLQKLGYSMEEQGELAAQVMANNNAAGVKRAMTDKEIAQQTADYGKTLKVLQDITGEDAKKAMEKARMKSMEADLMASAMAKGGPEAVKKLQSQLATIPDAAKKGYMEFVASGGKAVADAATNVAMTENPKLVQQFNGMFHDLGDASVDQKQALVNAGKYTEQTGKYARENLENTRQIGLGARMTGDSLLQGTADINNSLIMVGTKLKEGATDAADKATEGAAVNTAPLDKAVADLEADTQKTKAALTDKLTPAITDFAGQLRNMAKGVKETMDDLGIKSAGQKIGGAVGGATGAIGGGFAGGLAGAAAGAAIGSVVPIIGTTVGAVVGGLIGSAGGGWLGEKGGESAGEWVGEKFAVGGMVTQPTKALIGEAGPEAVVPLPDGKKIPVSFDGAMTSLRDTNMSGEDINKLTSKIDHLITMMQAQNGNTGPNVGTLLHGLGPLGALADGINVMSDLMNQQLDKHDEMLGHLKDSKDLAQKLLNVTM